MRRATSTARELLLWVGGGLGALCLVSLLAGWMFNLTPLVFSSGSMAPTYDAGALGVARQVDAADLAVGDVVSVRDDADRRVTHRIAALTHDGEVAVLTLRGDANDLADAQAYRVEQADQVVLGVPYAGYVLNAAASPFGLAVVALLVGASLLLGFDRGRRLVPVGLAAAVAAGVGLGASGTVPWAFTSAYWTDAAAATAQARTLSTPQTPTCTDTGTGGIAKMSFAGLGPSYEYYVELREVANNGSLISPPANTSVFGSGTPTTSQVELQFQIISGGGGNKDYDALIWSRLIGGANIGSPTVTHLQAGPQPNGPNWSAYCGHKKSYPGH
ncbi:signal peptidase I [Nocardioides sp. BYT-33-1]|uniref:signal peptidase I n=1 Tax=Nocardioides sp. BYT-33-1 TaxID=3416952 RepID=UPI003F52C2E7